MKCKDFHVRIPQPEWKIKFKNLLPTPGNVIFTLSVLEMLYFAQSVGVLPRLCAVCYRHIDRHHRLSRTVGEHRRYTVDKHLQYDIATGDAPLWEEQWTGSNSVKVSDGLFNVMFGSLTPIPQKIIIGNDTLYPGVTVGTYNK